MWRGERRGIDNGPAVRQQGVCACVCACVCMREREKERQRGVGEGQEGEISRKQSGQALCGAALGDCGGVYSVCVCCGKIGGGLSVHVFVPFFKLAVCMRTHLCGLNLGLFV